MRSTKDKEFSAAFAVRLARLIRDRCGSVAELTRRSGVSERSIQNYVADDDPQIPSADKAKKIAAALGLTTDQLLDLEGEIPEAPPAPAAPNGATAKNGHAAGGTPIRAVSSVTDPDAIEFAYSFRTSIRRSDLRDLSDAKVESVMATLRVMAPGMSPNSARAAIGDPPGDDDLDANRTRGSTASR